MANAVLDITNVITVTLQGAPTGLNGVNTSALALFVSQNVSPANYGGAAYKIYTDPASVGVDWGTTSNAYLLAVEVFSQTPNILTNSGYLAIVPLLSGGTEDLSTAVNRVLNQVYFFGVITDFQFNEPATSPPYIATIATTLQAMDKMGFFASALSADYAPNGSFDLVRQASETHTRCLYFSTSANIAQCQMAAAYASRLMSVNFSGVNVCNTMHLKSLAGVLPDQNISQSNLVSLGLAGVDCYVPIAGIPSVFTSGTNQFSDEIYNELAFKFGLEVAGFNLLRQTNTKIPQTETGMETLKNELRKVCEQFKVNGYMAPGVWTSSQVFGNPGALVRNVADIGYYVYSIPLSSQSTADRQARKASTIQIAAKAAGAIHSANVIVQINL